MNVKIKTVCAALLLLCSSFPTIADTGLVMTAPTAGQAASPASRTWQRPAAGVFVLSYPSVTNPVTWTDPQLQYREWNSIPATYGIAICTANITAGVFSTVDPCGDSAKPVVVKSSVQTAAVGIGTVTLTWVAPTKNTDGSTLTDLAGYNVYWGAMNPPTNKVTLLGSLTTYVFTNLNPAKYYFQITALNALGAESALIPVPPSSATISPPVVVAKTPNAPGTLTIKATVTTP